MTEMAKKLFYRKPTERARRRFRHEPTLLEFPKTRIQRSLSVSVSLLFRENFPIASLCAAAIHIYIYTQRIRNVE